MPEIDELNKPLGSRWRALTATTSACALILVGAAVAVLADAPPAVDVGLTIGALVLALVALGLLWRQRLRLRGLAETDPVTGLVNFRGFFEILDREIELARELNRPVTVVMLDLDGFKRMNEVHGHPYGDTILVAVGDALRATVRGGDHAARIGGDEFGVILPGADSEVAFSVAERVRAAISQLPVPAPGLGCSAGIATFPHDAEDATALSDLASSAMQWAKGSGKARTRRFDPEHSPATWNERQRSEIESLLALERPVKAVFQPIVGLASGRTVGYEALARFPSAGGRGPDVWFAQAHGCGLGAELEAAAIRAALEPVGRPFEAHLSVNVSPSALGSEVVQGALRGNLEGLVVEITEHEFVPDDDSLAAAIEDLRSRGAGIAIDDAGAGHAGLKQLMRVRPDIVKLDLALIRDIHTDPARIALVESFVRFARDVGATVCAEGIETLDELSVLADLDVEWGQGYVLARPSEPWATISTVAAELCRTSLADSFRGSQSQTRTLGSSDRRLVEVSARLAGARHHADLEQALELIAEELGATSLTVSAWEPELSTIRTLAEAGHAQVETTVFPIEQFPLSARVLREQTVIQVVVGDPDADPHEVELLLTMGQRSLLMIPVVVRGESIGLIEAYRDYESAWTRSQLNRGRVIANQFASVIPTLVDAPR